MNASTANQIKISLTWDKTRAFKIFVLACQIEDAAIRKSLHIQIVYLSKINYFISYLS